MPTMEGQVCKTPTLEARLLTVRERLRDLSRLAEIIDTKIGGPRLGEERGPVPDRVTCLQSLLDEIDPEIGRIERALHNADSTVGDLAQDKGVVARQAIA